MHPYSAYPSRLGISRYSATQSAAGNSRCCEAVVKLPRADTDHPHATPSHYFTVDCPSLPGPELGANSHGVIPHSPWRTCLALRVSVKWPQSNYRRSCKVLCRKRAMHSAWVEVVVAGTCCLVAPCRPLDNRMISWGLGKINDTVGRAPARPGRVRSVSSSVSLPGVRGYYVCGAVRFHGRR
jgi:hypothetical protein